MTNVTEWVKENKITATVKYAPSNPLMDPAGDQMNSYDVTLRGFGRELTVRFSCGMGIKEEPSAADVLNCCILDASGFDNAESFEGWCAEYGYDTDSRHAERIYKAVEKQTENLKKFLGQKYKDALAVESL